MRHRWHILSDGSDYTLARHVPVQFDVSASARFPLCDAGRLARQIRQDLWRMFRHLRGFSPVINISSQEEGMIVTAGGRLLKSSQHKSLSDQIYGLLTDVQVRLRWIRWAKGSRG